MHFFYFVINDTNLSAAVENGRRYSLAIYSLLMIYKLCEELNHLNLQLLFKEELLASAKSGFLLLSFFVLFL